MTITPSSINVIVSGSSIGSSDVQYIVDSFHQWNTLILVVIVVFLFYVIYKFINIFF